MAVSCKHLQKAAYHDSVWKSLYRQKWPQSVPVDFDMIPSVRNAFLARNAALQQFDYKSPEIMPPHSTHEKLDHAVMDDNEFAVSQDSNIYMTDINSYYEGRGLNELKGHAKRISCMRLFTLRNPRTFLVSASHDGFICMWEKELQKLAFKAHQKPVTTLSDELLGDRTRVVFASGVEGGTVCIWSLSRHSVANTYPGENGPVVSLSVPRDNPSVLLTFWKNSQVRKLDISTKIQHVTSSKVLGQPIGMKCCNGYVYVCTSSSLTLLDPQSLEKAIEIKSEDQIYSYGVSSSKYLVCTGGTDSALLWDVRNTRDAVARMAGTKGPVKLIHMDRFKVVTGGPASAYASVFDANDGRRIKRLLCCEDEELSRDKTACELDGGIEYDFGLSSMAARGCRIVTGGSDVELCKDEAYNLGQICFMDFDPPSCTEWPAAI